MFGGEGAKLAATYVDFFKVHATIVGCCIKDPQSNSHRSTTCMQLQDYYFLQSFNKLDQLLKVVEAKEDHKASQCYHFKRQLVPIRVLKSISFGLATP
jgi:hypothetical protein